MPIITNYEQLRLRALEGIKQYKSGMEVMGDRDGIYHGGRGQRRAYIAENVLRSVRDPYRIFAVLKFIFGTPGTGFFDISPGRSSRLASLIADQLIQGDYQTGIFIDPNLNPLSSDIFDKSALVKIASDVTRTHRVVSSEEISYSYFDKTRGMRSLLDKVLKEDLISYQERPFLPSKSKIPAYVRALDSLLNALTPINASSFPTELVETVDLPVCRASAVGG